MMNVKTLTGMLLAASLAGNGYAARPFSVDDAGTVTENHFEIETASDFGHDAADVCLVLKHGITNRMDLGLTVGYDALPVAERATTPLELNLKYAFIPDLLSGAAATNFTNGIWSGNLIVSRAFGRYTLHANTGLEAQASQEAVTATWGFAATVTTGRVTSGIEYTGTNNGMQQVLAGSCLTLAPWLTIDIGVGGDPRDNIKLTATSGLLFAF